MSSGRLLCALRTRHNARRQEGREKGRAEGREESRRQGQTEGKAQTLIRQPTRRFGPLPQATLERLAQGTSEHLDTWADRVLEASSLQPVFEEH